jgi:hypothetical protein
MIPRSAKDFFSRLTGPALGMLAYGGHDQGPVLPRASLYDPRCRLSWDRIYISVSVLGFSILETRTLYLPGSSVGPWGLFGALPPRAVYESGDWLWSPSLVDYVSVQLTRALRRCLGPHCCSRFSSPISLPIDRCVSVLLAHTTFRHSTLSEVRDMEQHLDPRGGHGISVTTTPLTMWPALALAAPSLL